MTNAQLKQRWHQQMLKIYEDGKSISGYNAVRFLQKVRRVGGYAAAKDWLNPQKASMAPTKGFLQLNDIGRLDISLEANALRVPWRRLFTPGELEVAANRLRALGYSGREIPLGHRHESLPEEVDGGGQYPEGAKRTITINAYERNARARKKCIAHYGAECSVCNLILSSRYGQRFDGFIHVHHIKPLASLGRSYKVDPILDLRPVCPNCHAVIHRREPPYTIYEVRKMLKGGQRGK